MEKKSGKKTLKRPVSNSDTTVVSAKKFCFVKSPSNEDINKVRRAQAALISTGTIPISKFESEEMQQLYKVIISSVLPNVDVENIVDKYATSARTLRRVADEAETATEKLILANSEKICETFSGSIIFDHQFVSFNDTTKGSKRLGITLMLRNNELKVRVL
jgi:hypothetical protein